MIFQFACACGNILRVSQSMAGLPTPCRCGRTVNVPALKVLQEQDFVPGPEASPRELETPLREPSPAEETLVEATLVEPTQVKPYLEGFAPIRVLLRERAEGKWGQRVPALAALTPSALWIQQTWKLRSLPLRDLNMTRSDDSRTLNLAVGPESADDQLTLVFPSAEIGASWFQTLQRAQQEAFGLPPGVQYVPEGVALLRNPQKPPFEDLGEVFFTGTSQWEADRGVQLKAGMRGADAVVRMTSTACNEIGLGARAVVGHAVRLDNLEDRQLIRLRWYREELKGLVGTMLLLLLIQVGLLLLAHLPSKRLIALNGPAPTSVEEQLGVAQSLGLLFGWPLLMVALLWALGWPRLLRPAGLAVLGATTGRALTIWIAHFLAVYQAGVSVEKTSLWILFDPFEWALMIWGLRTCVRAWRLARDADQMLPPENRALSPARRVCSGGLNLATCVITFGLLLATGLSRHELTSYLVQPGVDLEKEAVASKHFEEALVRFRKGDLPAAEQLWLKSLPLWKSLNKNNTVPSEYRQNLAMTLHNLGLICQKQSRNAEMIDYLKQTVAVADLSPDDFQKNQEYKESISWARLMIEQEREGKAAQQMVETWRKASKQLEEAQVKALKGEAEAEPLLRDNIATWEDLLGKVKTAEGRMNLTSSLASAHGHLGDLQDKLGKSTLAEASLGKAVEYGEKALALKGDSPLIKHNLDIDRQRLEFVRESLFEEEIQKLCNAHQYAEAIDRFARSIETLEKKDRLTEDRNTTNRKLASRLNEFAWFLAHCPDPRVRDAGTACKRATQATQLQPENASLWYTLAMVQYRKGDWKDSVESLNRVKILSKELDVRSLFLLAMNHHQLRQKQESKEALKRAADRLKEMERKAQEIPAMRYQLEFFRADIEDLKREAEDLIQGNDPESNGIG